MFHEESLPDEVFLSKDLLVKKSDKKLIPPYRFDFNDNEGR